MLPTSSLSLVSSQTVLPIQETSILDSATLERNQMPDPQVPDPSSSTNDLAQLAFSNLTALIEKNNSTNNESIACVNNFELAQTCLQLAQQDLHEMQTSARSPEEIELLNLLKEAYVSLNQFSKEFAPDITGLKKFILGEPVTSIRKENLPKINETIQRATSLKRQVSFMQKKANKTIQLFEKQVEYIRNTLKNRESNQKAAKKAERVSRQLIAEEANKKSKKTRRKNNPLALSKASVPSSGKQEVNSDDKEMVSNSNGKASSSPQLSPLQLLKPSNRCALHTRIRRWATEDTALIRQFADKNANGHSVHHYQNLTDQALLEQRARHFLPGVEAIWKDPQFRPYYTFPTDKGCGIAAKLTFQDQIFYGYLYLGICQKTQLVFHKYFQDLPNAARPNVFVDPQRNTQTKEEKEEAEEWNWTSHYHIDVLPNTHTLKFVYSDDYTFEIFPIHSFN